MSPEKAGLATLRAQLGYAGKTLDEKQGVVLNKEAKLARAVAEREETRQRYSEYLDAIHILEEAGYGGSDD